MLGDAFGPRCRAAHGASFAVSALRASIDYRKFRHEPGIGAARISGIAEDEGVEEMLTVKIVTENEELLFEAREVTKERSGLLVQTEGETEFYGPNGSRLALDAAGRSEEPRTLFT